jgi:hypothetical protein
MMTVINATGVGSDVVPQHYYISDSTNIYKFARLTAHDMDISLHHGIMMNATMLNATIEKPVSFFEGAMPSQIDWDSGRQVIIILATGMLVVVFYVLDAIRAFIFDVKAPVVGYRSSWEPGWLVGLRFARSSAPMLREGYQKVCPTTPGGVMMD